MTYSINYRHKGDSDVQQVAAETATLALKLCEHLAASDAEVLAIMLEGAEVSLGDIKNEAGREAAVTGRT